MTTNTVPATVRSAYAAPSAGAVLELLKPITWFPPMWAFGCGLLSAGVPLGPRWVTEVVGFALVGPLVCGASQAVNDWFDRHVDAINQPERPIPSGRMPGRWGLYVAMLWTLLSLAVACFLGSWGLLATAAGLALAWAYSAPPLRLKTNGWLGNAVVGISYEGLAWVTGAAVMLRETAPSPRILLLAGLYSIGAHGIMTLNDFKSIVGDLRMGIGSLPARLGPVRAARVACATMLAPQLVVIVLLAVWTHVAAALAVCALVLVQLPLMRRFLAEPVDRAEWYSGSGVTFYVLGMLACGLALHAGAGL